MLCSQPCQCKYKNPSLTSKWISPQFALRPSGSLSFCKYHLLIAPFLHHILLHYGMNAEGKTFPLLFLLHIRTKWGVWFIFVLNYSSACFKKRRSSSKEASLIFQHTTITMSPGKLNTTAHSQHTPEPYRSQLGVNSLILLCWLQTHCKFMGHTEKCPRPKTFQTAPGLMENIAALNL